MTIAFTLLLALTPWLGSGMEGPVHGAPAPRAGSELRALGQIAPTFGWNEKVYSLPGFNPLSGYFNKPQSLGSGYQIPTLSANYGGSFGIYYVDNSSNFVEYQLSNDSVRTIAPVVPLYQLFGYGTTFTGMLDNEFYIEYGYDQALFFGTNSSKGSTYSLELVNLTSDQVRIWNTSFHTDSFNQQANYVGNNTVIVLSSNCSIFAFNLASHLEWRAGTMGAHFGKGSTCFEANNIYWFPEKEQLINVEAHGDTGDHVEQLNATVTATGKIMFTSVATIAIDSGITFNWVNGLAYNATTEQIGFTAGDWALSTVYTYLLTYAGTGLLNASGEVRDTVYTGSTVSGKVLDIQRYVFTSDLMVGQTQGPSYWTNQTQYMFDPWTNTTVFANRTVDRVHFANAGFEGKYPESSDYLLDYNATIGINSPMYKVVYAYHGPFTAFPGPAEVLTPSSGPNRTLVSIQASGLMPSSVYNYCWAANSSAVGCPATSQFTSTSTGQVPTNVSATWTGGDSWLALANGTSASNFTRSSQFHGTTVNFSLTPNSGPNRTLVGLAGSELGPDTAYDYCWTGNSSAIGCPTTLNFTTKADGAIPTNVTTTWSGGEAWLAVSQGTSSTNFIASREFTETSENLSLSPNAGPNGTLVTLDGAGFGPDTTYNFCWAGNGSSIGCGSNDSFTANGSGGIPSGVNLTRTGGTAWLAISQGSSASNFLLSVEFTVTVANLSITPNGGPNGTEVNVSGDGFANATAYDFCPTTSASGVACSSQDTFRSNATGSIPAGVSLAWSGGTGWLAVSQGDSSSNFIVSTPFAATTPSLTLTPSQGPPGTEVTLTGSGLVPGATYDYCGSTSANAVGCPNTWNFRATNAGEVPAGVAATWPEGETWLAVSEGTSPANFILARSFELTIPSLSLTPGEGPPGTLVTLVGSGLAGNVEYDFCWVADALPHGCPANQTFTSTAAGQIPAGVTTTLAGGPEWLALSEGPSAGNFIVSFRFHSSTALLALSPGSGPNRSLIAFSGSGFAPDTRYDYCWTPLPPPLGCPGTANFTTNGTGRVPAGVTSTRTGGSAWLAVSQSPSATNFIASVWFNVTPAVLSLNPGSGPGGTLAELVGSGFGGDTTYAYCWVGNASATACAATWNFTSSGAGQLPAGLTVTVPAEGGWLAISQGSYVTNFIVSIEFHPTTPRLTLTPSLGPVHTPVMLLGSGFAPNTTYEYCFDPNAGTACPALSPTFVSDGSGTIPNSVVLRAPATGNGHVEISQGPLNPILSAGFTTTTPVIRSSVPGGPVNAMTTLDGSGFAAQGTVTVTIGGRNVSQFDACAQGASSQGTIQADPDGSFVCSFHIPGGIAVGADVIMATDGDSEATATAPFALTVPELVLHPFSGRAGDVIDVIGTGFDRNGSVALGLDSQSIPGVLGCTVGRASANEIGTDPQGAFNCTIHVPQNVPVGTWSFTATGSVSHASASGTFTVLGPPAGAPAWLGPPIDIGVGVIAGLAAISVVAVLLWIRKRRGPKTARTEVNPPSESGTVGPDAPHPPAP